jgi:ATPase subunit of ABC transporter with duplicated ATPase domains
MPPKKVVEKAEVIQREAIKVADVEDWTSTDAVSKTFPYYAREKIRIEAARSKTGASNAVLIEPFNLQTPYGSETLFKNTKLDLEPNKRTCVFGGNGTGKTSLFMAMATASIPHFPTHLNVYHCKELDHGPAIDEKTVLNTVMQSNPYLNALNECEAKLAELIASSEDEEKTEALKKVQSWVGFRIVAADGRNALKKTVDMLRILGFDDKGQQLTIGDLSGGLRMRVALAMAFFVNADLLLLDEPTNHLDFPSVLWLENKLRGYKGSFLLVTHDRDLLENVCTQVILLEDKKLHYYKMTFKAFELRKAKDDEKKEKDIDKFIAKNRNADPSTKMGKDLHDKKLWQTRYQAKLVQMQGKFTFPVSTKLDRQESDSKDGPVSLINLKDVRFSYRPDAEDPIFIFNTPISINITTESRLGIMGPNGAGKSTLLKLLTNKLVPTAGTVVAHPNYTLAYFGQHSTAELDLELTASEFMVKMFPEVRIGLLKSHLEKAGVVGDYNQTRMKDLSYSMRSCVIFAKLTYVCPHLLIMDEPTNFLDMGSVDSLIGACNKYKGALMVVTHSRGFLRKCAKQYLSVVPGKFEAYDTMKDAERATYSFINNVKAGGKIDTSGAMSAGGGAMSSQESQVTDEKRAEMQAAKKNVDADGCIVFSAKAKVVKVVEREDKEADAEAAAKKLEEEKAVAKKKAKAKAKAAKARAVGDMVEAKYKGDGKFYKARIEKVTAMAITVSFVDFGDEKAFVQAKDILNLGEKPPVKAKKGGKKDDAKSTKAKAGGKKK